MALADVAAALLSALLHAGWNAAVKASVRPMEAMTAQMLLGALIVLPGLAWTGLPVREAWPWIAASTLINVLTVASLLRAYALGGFGIVYPVMRAVSVLLVVPLAAELAGDRLGPAALAGVLLVVASLLLLAYGARRDRDVTPRALGWTLLAGLATAAYVICDGHGVRVAGSPLAYGFAVSVTNAAAMWWRQRRLGATPQRLGAQWRVALPTALAAVASYLLILWVWTRAPIAPAAALRDTSAVFAIVIAVAWLKERFTGVRLAAVLLAAAAVPLLRLA
jgi:drug/metabolite transporter (DMT)-like permease